MPKPQRINISPQTKAIIEQYALYLGHSNLSAALATIVAHGVPFLMSVLDDAPRTYTPADKQRIKESSFVDPQPHPQPEPEPITYVDATIERMALLLEEF